MSLFWKRIATAIVLILFVWLLYSIRFLVYYFFIAAAISFMARPLTGLLERVKIGRFKIGGAVSAVLVLLIVLGGILGILLVVIPPLSKEASALLNVDYQQLLKDGNDSFYFLKNTLANYGIVLEDYLTAERIESSLKEVFASFSVGGTLNSVLGFFGGFFVMLLSVIFISFFLIKDRNLLHRILFALVPDKHEERTKSVVENSKRLLTRYFIGLLIQVTLITILVSVGLLFLGVEYAVLLGVMAGLFNLIPYIGPLISATLALLISMFTHLDMAFYTELLPLLGKITAVFLIVQTLDNMLFQPIIFSNSVQAHPLEIFFVIAIAGTLAGILGMILAIPMYTFLRIIAKEFLSQNKIVQGLTKNL